jgi:hypothetical protein
LLALVRVAAPRRNRLGVAALVITAIIAILAAALWANNYFGWELLPPSIVTNGSEPQPDAPPPQPELSSAPAGEAMPAQNSAALPTERAATQPSPPLPRAAPSSISPASSAASDHVKLAAGDRGAATSSSRAPAIAPAASAIAPAAPPASAEGAPLGPLPRSRVELAADAIDVPLTDPAARIVVRRRGSLQGAVTFTWWTESGTAKPGHDFIAVAPHQEVIEDGKNSVSLFIPVVGDATRQQPKSFYVVINDPGPGATLGARTLTMVTIPPSQ